MIASTEKNRWEDVFGDGIWDVRTEEGTTYREELSREVDVFMRDLSVVCAAAEDAKTDLDRSETKAMRSAASEYYDCLSDEDREALGGVGKDDILALFEDYRLAQKYAQSLSESDALEVSDSEAKVIRVLSVAADDEETAEKFSSLVSGGEDFTAAARSLGLTAEEQAVGRGECGTEDFEAKALEDAEFALAEGGITDVMPSGGKYYVVKCIDDYDEEATYARRERISRQRLSLALYKICASYDEPAAPATPAALGTVENESAEISVADLPDCPEEADFFAIYEKYAAELST